MHRSRRDRCIRDPSPMPHPCQARPAGRAAAASVYISRSSTVATGGHLATTTHNRRQAATRCPMTVPVVVHPAYGLPMDPVPPGSPQANGSSLPHSSERFTRGGGARYAPREPSLVIKDSANRVGQDAVARSADGRAPDGTISSTRDRRAAGAGRGPRRTSARPARHRRMARRRAVPAGFGRVGSCARIQP